MSHAEPRPARPKTAIILCQVLELEIEHFAAGTNHVVHLEKLQQGLHNEPAKLQRQVQESIEPDRAGDGGRGDRAGLRPVQSRHRKDSAANAASSSCPGPTIASHCCWETNNAMPTTWPSTRAPTGTRPAGTNTICPPARTRAEAMFREYCEKYGEDNAKFLIETEQQWHRNYSRAAYVDVGGIGRTETDIEFTRKCADWLGWELRPAVWRSGVDPRTCRRTVGCRTVPRRAARQDAPHGG